MNIVLHRPEIPENTGNIGRTCMAARCALHLIEPLGFSLTEKAIKRSGMDYFKDVRLFRYINYADFLEKNPAIGRGEAHLYFATTKAYRNYCDVSYEPEDYIMFGRESAGIPEEILVENEAGCIRIPMAEGARSLNLANSASIVLYEALRQNGFAGLEEAGGLHRLTWKGCPS